MLLFAKLNLRKFLFQTLFLAKFGDNKSCLCLKLPILTLTEVIFSLNDIVPAVAVKIHYSVTSYPGPQNDDSPDKTDWDKDLYFDEG